MSPLIIVQARMASTRLPGKVLLPLAGEPMLWRQLQRILEVDGVDVVVATTATSADNPIRELCRRRSVRCQSGHESDLLDRHYRIALERRAEVVVKIPSDCPLVDPRVIERVIRWFHVGTFDYVSNLHPPSYPDGMDVEVMSFAALATAHREATRSFEREHCTPFLWERPERFRTGNVVWESGLDLSMTHRWTVDYLEDYRFVRGVYEELWAPGAIFPLEAVLALMPRRPDLFQTNAHLAGVNWYRHHLHELRTVGPASTRDVPQ